MSELELLAIQAHRSGLPWSDFWRTVADNPQAEPHRDELLHLWATGERSGRVPPEYDLPPHDTQEKPPDVGSRANIANSGLPWVSAVSG